MTDNPLFDRAILPKSLDVLSPNQPLFYAGFVNPGACPVCGSDAVELVYEELTPYQAAGSLQCARCGAFSRTTSSPHMLRWYWSEPLAGDVLLADGTPFTRKEPADVKNKAAPALDRA